MNAAPETVHGWADIARVLGVEVRAAKDRARRDYDPLPVRVGHAGPWAHLSALRDWIHRQDMAYTVSLKLCARSRVRKRTSSDVEANAKRSI